MSEGPRPDAFMWEGKLLVRRQHKVGDRLKAHAALGSQSRIDTSIPSVSNKSCSGAKI